MAHPVDGLPLVQEAVECQLVTVQAAMPFVTEMNYYTDCYVYSTSGCFCLSGIMEQYRVRMPILCLLLVVKAVT